MLDRAWQTYLVKPVFKATPKERPSGHAPQNNKDIMDGGEAQFFRLPNPLLTVKQITNCFSIERDGKKGKLYPPFILNEKGQASGFVKDAEYPYGDAKIEGHAKFPETAVTGTTFEPSMSDMTIHCHAIRIDGESGFPRQEIYKHLLEHLSQYTYQWWLRSPVSPFRGPAFLGAFIDTDYNILPEFHYKSANETESIWHGMVQGQNLLGLERPLDERLWLFCLDKVQKKIPAETGILTFLDAIAHYMAGDDNRCILDLAISFEILANKRMYADGMKMRTKNKDLLKETTLAEGETRTILRKLIIDRDHVAHGRLPYIVNKTPSIMTHYFEAMKTVLNKYLSSLEEGEFHELASINLGARPPKKTP